MNKSDSTISESEVAFEILTKQARNEESPEAAIFLLAYRDFLQVFYKLILSKNNDLPSAMVLSLEVFIYSFITTFIGSVKEEKRDDFADFIVGFFGEKFKNQSKILKEKIDL